MRSPRVAIITAVDAELAAFRELLALEDETDPRDGSVYFKGTLECPNPRTNCAPQWEVILPTPSSAGNVLSALVAGRVAQSIQPDVIMFVGCAGGFPGKVNLYDVVVAERIFYYEPGKVDDQLYHRPDLARPTRKLLERAKAEIQFDRWLSFLHPNLPNEVPVARLQPIAAGELLVKNSNSEHFKEVGRVSPRSVAIEQEGYGVLAAAREFGVEALVVRGISDMLDDKGSDPAEDLAKFNPRQVRATRHAAALSFSILANLDVSWIPEVAYVGSERTVKVTVVLEGNEQGINDVERQLLLLLKDGKLTGLHFSSGSIKATFDVEAEHAWLLKAAFDLGILEQIGGHRIRSLETDTPPASGMAEVLSELLKGIDLRGGPNEIAFQQISQFAEASPQYRHLLTALASTARERLRHLQEERATHEARAAQETRSLQDRFNIREVLLEMFGEFKGSHFESRLDVDLDYHDIRRFEGTRNFFVWPNLGQILYASRMPINEFYERAIVGRVTNLGMASLRNVVNGQPLSYRKALEVMGALDSICKEIDLEPRGCIVASVFSIMDLDLALEDSESRFQAYLPRSTSGLLNEMRRGEVVPLQVAVEVIEEVIERAGDVAARYRLEIDVPREGQGRRHPTAKSVIRLSERNEIFPAQDGASWRLKRSRHY